MYLLLDMIKNIISQVNGKIKVFGNIKSKLMTMSN